MQEHKKTTYLFVAIIAVLSGFFMMFPTTSLAQPKSKRDTLATIILNNILQRSSHELEFDLRVRNDSTVWIRWANGTFQFNLPIDSLHKCSVALVAGTSELPQGKYIITPRIITPLNFAGAIASRISITTEGPDTFDECVTVQEDSLVRIGRFRVTSPSDVILPPTVDWLRPLAKYQANAYKIRLDEYPWYGEQDNIEIMRLSAVRFEIEPFTIDTLRMKVRFAGEYIGDKQVRLWWETSSEGYNNGFMIKRGLRPFGDIDDRNTDFSDTTATYYKNPSLTGLGFSKVGKKYEFQPDNVKYRGEEYRYILFYENFANSTLRWIPLDTISVKAPNSVITDAGALVNPFYERTTIWYRLDDRVLLTARVYDATGKLVETLLDGVERQKGYYSDLEFQAPLYASNGLYSVKFFAVPLNDASVELSTAAVKLQLLR